MTIEELENKILDGDFDEYTLDEYRAKICNEQKNRYIDKACKFLLPRLKFMGCSPDGAQEILRQLRQAIEEEL